MKACQANPHMAWAMSMIVACCIDCQIVIMGLWQTPSITMYLQTLCLPHYGVCRTKTNRICKLSSTIQRLCGHSDKLYCNGCQSVVLRLVHELDIKSLDLREDWCGHPLLVNTSVNRLC